MDLKIDQATVSEIVKKAILEQIGEDQRETLISAALEHLLTEQKTGSYGYNQPSPLQQAFNLAVAEAAREIVIEEIATDEEFKARVRQKVGEAMVQIDEDNFSVFVGEALGEALKKARG